MKKPLHLAVVSLVFTLMFSSVAYASPEVDETKIKQESSSSTVQVQEQVQEQTITTVQTKDQPAKDITTIQTQEAANTRTKAPTAPVAKTSLASAQVSKQGMIRHVISGKELKPNITIKIAGKLLQEGKDYRLKYGSDYKVPTKAGTYKVYAEALESSAYSGRVPVGEYKLLDSSFKSNIDYYIGSAANSNYLLDASGKKPHQGSNVTVWSRNNGANQKWRLTLEQDGYYVIKNVANSSLVLDASGKSPRKGSNVSAWSSNKGLNQKWLIEKIDGYFVFYNAANPSLVMDASGKSPRQGANVTTWSWNKGLNQKWTVRSIEDIYAELDRLAAQNKNTVKNGTYTIYASGLSGYPVLDVRGGTTNEGANVQTGASNASANQLWEISHSSNYVLIKNKKSNKYLSVASNNSLSGANVIQSSNANARGAKWIFTKNSDGSYAIRSALYTEVSLDVYGGRSSAGTNIEIWTRNGTAAQKFALVLSPANVAKGNNVIDTSGYYFIKSTKNTNLQLDVTGASTKNNANIELWNTIKAPWQIFCFEYLNGYYRIINMHTKKALTVANNSLVPGANVVNYSSSSADNQLWQARRNADGSYSFINKKNGFALQIGSSAQKAGTNINTSWYSSNNANQRFKLEKLSYLMPTGLQNLKSALNSAQLLDVANNSTSENANVEIWSNNGGLNQKWNVQTVSGKNNTYTLQVVCSGKYLADNGMGNAVQVSSGIDAKSQWVASISGGSYVLTNVATGKALDVINSKASSGANVGTKARTGAANQRWNLSETIPLPNGTYIIRSKANTSMVFDVAGCSTSNSANVDMWKYNGGGNQKFNFTRNGDGTYTIVNCNNGKALDAFKAQSSVGTNIVQFARNGQKNQRWRVVFNNDGGFKLVSAMNSQVVIAFNGNSPANGSNVCLVKDTGASAQHFKLEKTTYVPPMPWHQRDMLNRAQGYSSGTGYLILVNRGTHHVGVFKGRQGNWSYQQYWSCVTGTPGSPTITGVYRTSGFKRLNLTTDSRARWCTQINGGYFFHSILASDNELGKSLSHGCVRLSVPCAQWIYNNIGRGTTVALFN